MTRMQPDLVKKYCEALDRFLKIRKFTSAQIEELLEGADIPDKHAYQQFVISACIVEYREEVLGELDEAEEQSRAARENTEEALYQLCVGVNPALELNRVTFPVEQDEDEGLHVFSPDRQQDSLEEMSMLEDMEERLGERIVGQQEAVERVADLLKRAGVGFRNPEKPIGTLLFVGQTGVGKTELARVVADLYFDDTSNLVRVDCSEYAQPHETARLTGAPPGYIGHGEGGVLSDALQGKSQSVVLFDEVEKASARLHHLLLQVLDEGFLTDSEGMKIRFNNSLIIMTSNLGVSYIDRLKNRMGFDFHSGDALDRDQLREETLKALRNEFPPEFLGRVSDTIMFNPLSIRECVKIVDQILEDVREHIQHSDLRLDVTRPAKKHLAEEGYSPRYGARALRNTVIQHVEQPLSEQLIAGDVSPGDRIKVRLRNGSLRFHRN